MQNRTLFKAENISKEYPGTVALRGINMEINAGEVVGLIGENGAGKSTLLKIIMGIEQPTTGRMELHGKEYAPQNPIHANSLGVGMVFQEQSLIQNLTVGQNIFFGQEKKYRKFGVVNWKRMYEDTKQALGAIGISNVRPDRKVSQLDFATRQMVEIAKVFNIVSNASVEGSIILLDEPTSVLNDEEVKQLYKQIDKKSC